MILYKNALLSDLNLNFIAINHIVHDNITLNIVENNHSVSSLLREHAMWYYTEFSEGKDRIQSIVTSVYPHTNILNSHINI